MVRSIASKVAWAGKTASMVFGVALILGLMVGLADAALGANGQAWVLGQINRATATTQLNGKAPGKAALVVNNFRSEAGSKGLQLNVDAGKAPLAVNQTAGKATNLSADELDGIDSSELLGMGATLQPSQTLAGVFAASSGATGGIYNTAVGFRPKLPADIDNAHFHYLTPGQSSADCPGEGQAAPGHLCFYTSWINVATFHGAYPANSGGRTGNEADQLGTVLFFDSTGAGSNVRGTWAVAAPQTASQSVREAQEQPAGESQSTPMGRVAR